MSIFRLTSINKVWIPMKLKIYITISLFSMKHEVISVWLDQNLLFPSINFYSTFSSKKFDWKRLFNYTLSSDQQPHLETSINHRVWRKSFWALWKYSLTVLVYTFFMSKNTNVTERSGENWTATWKLGPWTVARYNYFLINNKIAPFRRKLS